MSYASTAMTSAPPAPAPVRVLIIEDEPAVRLFLARSLRPWQVTVVGDGLTASKRLAEGDWDAILCDLTLPGLDGPTLYQRATASQRRRFLFMTGGAYTPEAQDFLERCGAPTLYKPFDPDDVREHIERLLRASEAP